ncbi:DNA methyltransferase [Proteus mirabilis]|uniref:DNA methyltransferase n=1 Tax=Proteus mirabilis TaxID=584 RepID=UPI00235FB23E|nr:DNA methyltransferase [Proteus mirabilis]MDC9753618.1 DNA methyltransferase [Proteus mirabilis]
MSKYNELVKKLKEIFQIDRPELDFGIYRILNSRADEINDYLDNKLKSKIQTALADAGNANKADLEQQLQAVIKATTEAGFEPDQSPKVQALKKQIAETATGASEHENAVFSHLLTFFSRYYDNGDFISKRRYKGDTYAIPYAGEEVMLHWANKDQYYIKSGENFANYAFKLDDGRKVSFKLLAADTAKDNRKDNDADRRFVLIEPHTRTKLDEDGEEFEQTYKPVEVVKSTEIINGESVVTEELVIHFEYKAMKKGTKQDALVQTAIATILSDSQVQQYWADLSKRAPTESNPSRTELERHLTTYTQRNTADYFIHKDLGGFLSNELDFYIKNEVMNLDNVQNAEVFANIEKQLRMIQCLRSVAQELITFLTQLENFQKKLWTKKKFVVNTDYLITVDRIPDSLLDEIVQNDEQISQWISLGLIDKNAAKSLSRETIRESYPSLVCDTLFFDASFKENLYNDLDDIDNSVTGVIINSDNYQALNLISEKYKSSMDFIYIDPPYNTVHSKILYKNQFEHSSWLSLINNTMSLSRRLLKSEFSFGFAIDDYEFNNAYKIIEQSYSDCEISTIVVNHHPQGSGGRLSRTHEYFIVASPSHAPALLGAPKSDEIEERPFMRSGTAENNYRYGRWKSFYALLWDSETKKFVGVEEPPELGSEYPIENTANGLVRIYPINSSGEERVWRSSFNTGKERVENGELIMTERGSVKQVIHHKGKRETLFSNWTGSDFNAGTQGTYILDSMGLGDKFDYPKSVKTLEQTFWMQSYGKTNFHVIDYFAGSGTTAHAVNNLNRVDGGNRKYILVEQGEYFNSATKPRCIKSAYSNSWKNGKSLLHNDGVSSLIKVIKLESYEDSLNNIFLSKRQTEDLFKGLDSDIQDDYLIKYMIEVEAKASFLNTSDFRKPFSYEMDIAADSAGATERKPIDLVETFNFLIGLHVKSIESNIERGFVRVEGTLPSGERTLILWRDCEKIGYEKLNEYANRFDLYAKEQTFDVIYINGDHNLPTAFTVDGNEGDVMRSLKLRQIEPEFLSLMFAEEI